MDISKLPERFRSKIRISHRSHNGLTGCWEWIAGTVNGYGQYWYRGKNVFAHRFAYHHLVGGLPIRPGRIRPGVITTDHLCRNRRCVNPAHLDPVTIRVNILRGIAPTAKNARKTHCPAGHPYTAQNTIVTKHGRGRTCRICMAGHIRRFQERNREKLRQARHDYVARNREHVNSLERQRRELKRATKPPRVPVVKTHCPQGHEYTTGNVVLKQRGGGGRYRACRECLRVRALEYRWRNIEIVRARNRDAQRHRRMARGLRGNYNARKTHCKHGHAFTPENTGAIKGGGRYCRTCKREDQARRDPEAGRLARHRWYWRNVEKARASAAAKMREYRAKYPERYKATEARRDSERRNAKRRAWYARKKAERQQQPA